MSIALPAESDFRPLLADILELPIFNPYSKGSEELMPEERDDTKFADAAIRFGFAKLEQVEECLKLQERISRAGLKPKPLAQLMLAKGYITKEQLDKISTGQAGQTAAKSEPPAQTAVATKTGNNTAAAAPSGTYQIPGYDIIGKIGEGAVGGVYKAKQLSMDRVVAIKILADKHTKNEKMREKFMSEARTAAKLSHPNIVQAIDVGIDTTTHYFVMEYIDGPTVGHLLKRGGALDEKRALNLVIQVGQALDYAHRHGIIHRDIKPDNIMMTREGVVKLCDLGLARTVHDPDQVKSGVIVGTPFYISPEQAKGDPNIDARADIYSLGATFYHMVCGEVPFPGDNAVAVVTKHLTEPLTPPRQRQSLVSPEVSYIICKMMAKNRDERYTSSGLLLKDLTSVAEGASPQGFVAQDATRRKIASPAAPSVGRPPMRRRRRFRR
jgi:serine/threonine-protein kinase